MIVKFWPYILAVLGVAAIFVLWQSDRNSQFNLGVAKQKAETAELINKSRELTSHEKNSALDIATDAARSVCVERGADTRECEGL